MSSRARTLATTYVIITSAPTTDGVAEIAHPLKWILVRQKLIIVGLLYMGRVRICDIFFLLDYYGRRPIWGLPPHIWRLYAVWTLSQRILRPPPNWETPISTWAIAP